MRKISILALCLFAILPTKSHAQTGEWFDAPELKARLIGGSDNQAALQIDLADGWHTYWRIPGDSGLPPMMSWAKSKNIKDVEIQYPAPKRKKEMDFYTFGYDDEVIFPLSYAREDKSSGATLDLNAQVMICKDICIPQRLALSLDIKNGDMAEQDAIITAAKAKIPSDSVEGITIDSIVAAKDSLVVSVTSQNGFDGMDIFPIIEEDSMALSLPPSIEISKYDPKKATIRVDQGGDFENLASALQSKTLSVTLTHADKSMVKSVQY